MDLVKQENTSGLQEGMEACANFIAFGGMIYNIVITVLTSVTVDYSGKKFMFSTTCQVCSIPYEMSCSLKGVSGVVHGTLRPVSIQSPRGFRMNGSMP